MPCFIGFCFKRPHVDSYLDLELALEILRHSPRVPAHRTSTILEFAHGENSCFFVHDPELWLGLPFSILYGAANVFFPRLSLNCDADRKLLIAGFSGISSHQKRWPRFLIALAYTREWLAFYQVKSLFVPNFVRYR